MIERRTLEDIHEIAAFLVFPKKFNVTFKKSPIDPSRIVAVVEGSPSDIEQVFQGIEDNADVGLLDYIRALRKVKTRIFELKAAEAE